MANSSCQLKALMHCIDGIYIPDLGFFTAEKWEIAAILVQSGRSLQLRGMAGGDQSQSDF
jgi:hypothetical protein